MLLGVRRVADGEYSALHNVRSQWRVGENGSYQLVAAAILLIFLGQA